MGWLSSIFGFEAKASLEASKEKTYGNTWQTETTGESSNERLILDTNAINKIVDDVLSGPDAAQGLADIFAGEQRSGLYDSSVAAQEAGDLTANLIGELAKVTAEKQRSGTNTKQTDKREDYSKTDVASAASIGIS